MVLSDLFDVIGGGTPKTTEESYWNGSIPWLSVKDFGGGKKYVYSTEKTITEKGLENSSTKLLYKDDTIISARGTVGEVAMIPFPMAFNQSCFGLRSRDNNNPHFIFYLVKHKVNELKSQTQGSVFDTITKATFDRIECEEYSIEKQNRIASILSSLDRKIELNNKINAQLEEMAQAIFKSWLSECTKEATIGDLSQNILDYSKCKKEEVILINSSDVTEGLFEHHKYVKNENLKGHFKKRFQKGDILYSQVRPRNRHWAYCNFDANDYLASTQLMVIRNKPEVISSIMLYQYLISEQVWMEFTSKTETRSGTFPQGNYEEISSIVVPFGNDANKINIQLESIYEKVFSNQQQNLHLAQLRDTLLPKLMNGEIEI